MRCPIRPASSATRLRATPQISCTDRSACSHPLRRTGPKGSGQFERDLVGGGARRDLRAGQRSYRPVGTAGGHAAELCRPARLPRRRQHVLALLPPARRHPALPAGIVRRSAQRGLGRDLWRRSRMPARIRRARQAQRRLGQQCDGHQSAPRAEYSPGQAGRRQAGRRRPAAHENRRAGGSASAIAARHRRPARLVRSPPNSSGRARWTTPSSPPMCWASRSSWRGPANGPLRGRPRRAD